MRGGFSRLYISCSFTLQCRVFSCLYCISLPEFLVADLNISEIE